MSRTDQVYIPLREAGRGRSGQLSPPRPSNSSRQPVPQAPPRTAGGGGAAASGGGSQYVLRLESPQKQNRKRSSLFDSTQSNDEDTASVGSNSSRRQHQSSGGRNVRPARRVENENPASVLHEFARNIQASQDELKEINEDIAAKRTQLEEAERVATEIVVETGKLQQQVEHGEDEVEKAKKESSRLRRRVETTLTMLMEELVLSRESVKQAVTEGERELEEVEARLAAEVVEEIANFEEAIRVQESTIENLEEELAAATSELESCRAETEAVEARNKAEGAEIDAMQQELQRLENDIGLEHDKIRNADEEQGNLMGSIVDAEARAVALAADEKTMKLAAEAEREKVDKEIETQEQKNKELRASYAIEEEKRAREEEIVASLELQLVKTREEGDSFDRAIDSIKRETDELKKQLATTEEASNRLKEDVRICSEKSAEMEARHAANAAAREMLSEEYDMLREKVDEAKERTAELQKRLAERLQAIKVQLMRDIAEAQETNARLEDDIKTTDEKAEELNASVAALTEEISVKADNVSRLKEEIKTTMAQSEQHLRDQADQKAALARDMETAQQMVEEAKSRLEDLMTKQSAAQQAFETADSQRSLELKAVADLESQLQSILDGSSLTEADHELIESEAQQRLADETKEQNARHESQVQDLEETLRTIREGGEAKMANKRASFEARCRELTTECEAARSRVVELKSRIADVEARIVRQKEESDRLKRIQEQEEEARRMREAEEAERRKKEQEEAEARKKRELEEAEARTKSKVEEAERLKRQKKEQKARKKQNKEAAARLKRLQQEEELKDRLRQEAEEKKRRSARRENKQQKSLSRIQRDEQEAEDESDDKDKAGNADSHASQVILPSSTHDWDEAMRDEYDDDIMPEDNAEDDIPDALPRLSPPATTRNCSDAGSTLSREAMAAFDDTPLRQESVRHAPAGRGGRGHTRDPGQQQQRQQRPIKKPTRRHSTPHVPSSAPQASSSPSLSQDLFFQGPRRTTLIPDISFARGARSVDLQDGASNTQGQSSSGQLPEAPDQPEAQQGRHSSKDVAFGAKNKKQPPAPRSVSVSTSRITIEETRTTYENVDGGGARGIERGGRGGRGGGAAKKTPTAKRRRSATVGHGDEWFDDSDPYVF